MKTTDKTKYEYIEVNGYVTEFPQKTWTKDEHPGIFLKLAGGELLQSDIAGLGADGWEMIDFKSTIIKGTRLTFRRPKDKTIRKHWTYNKSTGRHSAGDWKLVEKNKWTQYYKKDV